jgi:endonuclease/exonuclease/phosphatase family metal-dependent hydrolase
VPLRLATFNLESLDFAPSDPLWFEARAAVLRPVLAALDADVLCLQEVNAQHQPGEAQRSLLALRKLMEGSVCAGFHLVHSTRPGGTGPADVHNLAILSRWPIASHGQIHHALVPPTPWTPLHGGAALPLTFDRPLLHARIEAPGERPLHLINLHLRAPRAAFLPGGREEGRWRSLSHWAEAYYLAGLKRQAQALEARLFVERLFGTEPEARIAVCGDMNAEAHEAPTRILQALPEDMETQAFAARALTPLERRVPEEARFTVLHDGRPVLLDHILASPALAAACRQVRILNAGLADEAHVSGPAPGSLHAPMLAIFD